MLFYNNRPLYYYPAAVAEGVAALQTTTANPLEPIGSLICEMIQSTNKPRIKIAGANGDVNRQVFDVAARFALSTGG
jgi:hypothetical protein